MKSLFIGRYQPFHDGHKKLMQTVLDEGKSIIVAIMDTAISKDNPYTVEERYEKIRVAMAGKKVEIIVIPQIGEVCYGREVGYKIRKIVLDKKTESISATKIRNENNMR